MKNFHVQFTNQPWRNRKFKVRGVCQFDVLNPCWDSRKNDVPGKHWGGGKACNACTKLALECKGAP